MPSAQILLLQGSDHFCVAILTAAQMSSLQILVAGHEILLFEFFIELIGILCQIQMEQDAGGDVVIPLDQSRAIGLISKITIAEGAEGSQFFAVIGLAVTGADRGGDKAKPQELFLEAGRHLIISAEIERGLGMPFAPLLLQSFTERLADRELQLSDHRYEKHRDHEFIRIEHHVLSHFSALIILPMLFQSVKEKLGGLFCRIYTGLYRGIQFTEHFAIAFLVAGERIGIFVVGHLPVDPQVVGDDLQDVGFILCLALSAIANRDLGNELLFGKARAAVHTAECFQFCGDLQFMSALRTLYGKKHLRHKITLFDFFLLYHSGASVPRDEKTSAQCNIYVFTGNNRDIKKKGGDR